MTPVLVVEAVAGAVVAAGAVRVAWVDCRRREIELETLTAVVVAAAAALWLEGGAARIGLSAGCAAALVAPLALAVRGGVIRRPGAGDWPLMAACGFLAAGQLLVFAAVLACAGLGAAVVSSRRRRRALLRSRFPLAPPALLAAVAAFFARNACPGGFW